LAQAKIYAHIIMEKEGLSELSLKLISTSKTLLNFNIPDNKTTVRPPRPQQSPRYWQTSTLRRTKRSLTT
ncbi:MAG TPA: hypothetical protein K8U83_05170, partial [Corynebacterium stationis]|uniref:hypothetical protein n=1 Tax=Corynebacterium stationis TaxID=1705 RepID=UPI001E14368D